MVDKTRDELNALQEGWLELIDRVNDAEAKLRKDNVELRAAISIHVSKFQDLPERSGKRKKRVNAILESCLGLLENLDLVEAGEYDDTEANEAFIAEQGFEVEMPDIPRLEVKNRKPTVINSNPNSIDDTEVDGGKRCVYIWRVTGTNVFKVGVTSPHLGLKRLHDVINALGHDAEILRIVRAARESDATEIEKAVLAACAAQVPVDLLTTRLSGRYEFVEFFEHQLSAVLEFMDENHHPYQ